MPTYSTSTPSATIRQETEPSASDYLYWIKASTNETYYSDGTNWTLIKIFSIPAQTTAPDDTDAGLLWFNTNLNLLFRSDGTNYFINYLGTNYKLILSDNLINETFNLTDLERDKSYLLILDLNASGESNLTLNNLSTSIYKSQGMRFDGEAVLSAQTTSFLNFIQGLTNTKQFITFNGSSQTSVKQGLFIQSLSFGKQAFNNYGTDKIINISYAGTHLTSNYSIQSSSNLNLDLYLFEEI